MVRFQGFCCPWTLPPDPGGVFGFSTLNIFRNSFICRKTNPEDTTTHKKATIKTKFHTSFYINIIYNKVKRVSATILSFIASWMWSFSDKKAQSTRKLKSKEFLTQSYPLSLHECEVYLIRKLNPLIRKRVSATILSFIASWIWSFLDKKAQSTL